MRSGGVMVGDNPKKVSAYLERNFLARRWFSQKFSVPVEALFQQRWGDCDEYAELAAYWLTQHGYEAYLADLRFDQHTASGYANHDVCVFKEPDGTWRVIDSYFHHKGGNPVRPFSSALQACEQGPPHFGVHLARCDLYDVSGKLVNSLQR